MRIDRVRIDGENPLDREIIVGANRGPDLKMRPLGIPPPADTPPADTAPADTASVTGYMSLATPPIHYQYPPHFSGAGF